MQLIFRKVADVKKEHELSERQKNEAPLDLPSDHPLRKLISRFRRRSERNLLSPLANHGADPEVAREQTRKKSRSRPGSARRADPEVVTEQTRKCLRSRPGSGL